MGCCASRTTRSRTPSVLIEAVVESLEADLEDVRRLLLVTLEMLECREDQAALGLRDRGADLELQARFAHASIRDAEGQRVDADLVFRHDESALHHVAQLAHVAGPAMDAQALDRRPRELLGGALLLVEAVQEVLGQELDVLPSLPERGQVDGE